MKKKAFEWDIKTIILVLVIFIVLFYITKGIASFLTDSGSAQACLLSVLATTKTRGVSGDTLGLECHTKFIGDIRSKIKKTEDQKYAVMNHIADEAYECWMQFGEGKHDVFEGKVTSKPAHCFICTKFNIDAGTSGDLSKDPIDQADFIEFIKDNNLGSGKSYYDFLYNGILSKDPSKKNPKIFIDKMDLNPGSVKSALESLKSIKDKAKGMPSDKELKDSFSKAFNNIEESKIIERLDKNGQSGYAIIYYQISDYYWKQHFFLQFVSWIYDIATDDVDEDAIPTAPAYIIITPYDKVTELGCDMLQG